MPDVIMDAIAEIADPKQRATWELWAGGGPDPLDELDIGTLGGLAGERAAQDVALAQTTPSPSQFAIGSVDYLIARARDGGTTAERDELWAAVVALTLQIVTNGTSRDGSSDRLTHLLHLMVEQEDVSGLRRFAHQGKFAEAVRSSHLEAADAVGLLRLTADAYSGSGRLSWMPEAETIDTLIGCTVEDIDDPAAGAAAIFDGYDGNPHGLLELLATSPAFSKLFGVWFAANVDSGIRNDFVRLCETWAGTPQALAEVVTPDD